MAYVPGLITSDNITLYKLSPILFDLNPLTIFDYFQVVMITVIDNYILLACLLI